VGDALAKRAAAIVHEYARILDVDELERSVREIGGSAGYGRVLVQQTLLESLTSADVRRNGGRALVALLERRLLDAAEVESGLSAYMVQYVDLLTDAPKAGEFTAMVSFSGFCSVAFPSFCASDDWHPSDTSCARPPPHRVRPLNGTLPFHV
jgi:hypothetical protein